MMGAGRTVAAALREAARVLDAAGVPEAPREARLLLGHALRAAPEALIARPERMLRADEADRLDRLVSRRRGREPMSHVLGRREFWSMDFRVTPDVLDPRPDSETVVEAVLDAVAGRRGALRILDLGTGTGCLLAALLSELPDASGVGVDISEPALAVAEENLARLGFADRASVRRGDWGTDEVGPFDVIVANPPYVASGDIARLAPEIARYEPKLALDGGADGLAAYRAIAPHLARLLAADGIAAVEIGAGQDAEITDIFSSAGLEIGALRHDLNGIPRCVLASSPVELTVT